MQVLGGFFTFITMVMTMVMMMMTTTMMAKIRMTMVMMMVFLFVKKTFRKCIKWRMLLSMKLFVESNYSCCYGRFLLLPSVHPPSIHPSTFTPSHPFTLALIHQSLHLPIQPPLPPSCYPLFIHSSFPLAIHPFLHPPVYPFSHQPTHPSIDVIYAV